MLRNLLLTFFLLIHFGAYTTSIRQEISDDYEVLTLSAAIMDHYFDITEEQLKLITNEKGGWAPIDRATLTSILSKSETVSKMVPGGSGANVSKGLAQLGEKCALIGKVGDDDKGEYYTKKLQDYGVISLFKKGTLPTGEAICLITPDGERTFRTYLGASHSLTDLTFDKELFTHKIRHFHLEGYQLVDQDLVLRMLKLAKKANVTISIDLANVEIVRRNEQFIREILKNYIDIVFCNEREAKALTGLSASESCDMLAKLCDIAVVTMSERGSWIRRGDTKVYMEALSVKAIDTTGAGDLYASGFLHGYLQGYPLKDCAWIAAFVSSHVVKRIGPEIPKPVWEEIKNQIKAKLSMNERISSSFNPRIDQAFNCPNAC
ncbi:MAG: adenosine kinase [Chlamydiales bacterium]|nr:adenosine kinase [Chlamydiia bacterium]MCP5504555.1 adenosine kinase [Chlamydiales bacterium]